MKSAEMNTDFPFFTVFTPCFNRAHTLHRVYTSLRKQTWKDLEWLIVDDGSTDHTESVVRGWQEEAPFPIRYFYQDNSGKHFAHNMAVEMAHGAFFSALDSDDGCVPEAMSVFRKSWLSVPPDQFQRTGFVWCLCQDEHGNQIGRSFPSDGMMASNLDMCYRYKIRAEHWWCARTEVLRKYPFPAIAEGGYLPEGVVWGRVAQSFQTKFINMPLRIYYRQDSGERVMGSAPQRHPRGHAYYHACILNEHLPWFRHAPLDFFRSAVHFTRFSLHAGQGFRAQAGMLNSVGGRALWISFMPFALFVYWRDNLRKGIAHERLN